MKYSRGGVLEPSVAEHGLDGFTSEAVGGFGENYDSQVAHGADQSGAPSPAELEAALRHVLGQAHVDAADLVVHFRGGRATLSGTVRSLEEKQRLATLARSVPGVSEVDDRMRVESR